MRKRDVVYIIHYFAYAILSNSITIIVLFIISYFSDYLPEIEMIEYNRGIFIASMFYITIYLLISSFLMAIFFYFIAGIREKISFSKLLLFAFSTLWYTFFMALESIIYPAIFLLVSPTIFILLIRESKYYCKQKENKNKNQGIINVHSVQNFQIIAIFFPSEIKLLTDTINGFNSPTYN